MLDFFMASVRAVAKGWREDVTRRRRVSPIDPVADTLEYAARTLEEVLRRVEWDCRSLTPEEYAKLEGVTPQAVRKWIRSGELPALRGQRGWLISAYAKRKRNATSARTNDSRPNPRDDKAPGSRPVTSEPEGDVEPPQA